MISKDVELITGTPARSIEQFAEANKNAIIQAIASASAAHDAT